VATVTGVLGGLTVLQLRFAGEWTVVLLVVAAVVMLEHCSRIGLCTSPLDERQQRLLTPAPAGVLILVPVVAIGLVVSVSTAGAMAVDGARAGAVAYLEAHRNDEYKCGWHVEIATRVWQQGDVSVRRVAEEPRV